MNTRRYDLSQNSPVEIKIREAITAVEEMLPASEKATEAIIKLTESLNIVGDITDNLIN